MCSVKTPTVSKPEDKKVPVMRNRYFDGIDPNMRAQQLGTASLRIDRGSGAAPSYQIRSQRAASANAAYTPAPAAAPTPVDVASANRAKATAVVARVLGVPIRV